jgi:hypothetical protein
VNFRRKKSKRAPATTKLGAEVPINENEEMGEEATERQVECLGTQVKNVCCNSRSKISMVHVVYYMCLRICPLVATRAKPLVKSTAATTSGSGRDSVHRIARLVPMRLKTSPISFRSNSTHFTAPALFRPISLSICDILQKQPSLATITQVP